MPRTMWQHRLQAQSVRLHGSTHFTFRTERPIVLMQSHCNNMIGPFRLISMYIPPWLNKHLIVILIISVSTRGNQAEAKAGGKNLRL